jgi:hypothetical protein
VPGSALGQHPPARQAGVEVRFAASGAASAALSWTGAAVFAAIQASTLASAKLTGLATRYHS